MFLTFGFQLNNLSITVFLVYLHFSWNGFFLFSCYNLEIGEIVNLIFINFVCFFVNELGAVLANHQMVTIMEYIWLSNVEWFVFVILC
jgi:hypothetical protein